MSNYYVHRSGEDEYLEHSIFQKGVRGSHKYIARMPIGGKMRYFYDPRELAVFKAGGRAAKAVGGAVANVRRKAGNFIDRNITGASAKGRMDRLGSQRQRMLKGSAKGLHRVNQAYNSAKSSYNNSLFGRVANAGKAIGKAAGNARDAAINTATNARTAARKAVRRADQAIGITASRNVSKFKKNMNTARKVAGSAVGTKNYGANRAEYKRQKTKYDTANKYYRNHTLLGRAQNFVDSFDPNAAAEEARNRYKKTKKKIKKGAKNASKNAYLTVQNWRTGKKA